MVLITADYESCTVTFNMIFTASGVSKVLKLNHFTVTCGAYNYSMSHLAVSSCIVQLV